MLSMPAMDGSEQNPDYNLMLAKYSNNILLRGWKTRVVGSMGVSEIQDLVVDEFLLITAFGGGVKYFNPFIKVAEADIDNEIPEGLPNRTYSVCIEDCEEEEPIMEERVHTWRTWRDANHPLSEPIEDEEGNKYYYFMSASLE